MIINKCKIVNNIIIKNVKKGSSDTTFSEPSVTMETGNIFEKNVATNSQINFRETNKIWGQNNMSL